MFRSSIRWMWRMSDHSWYSGRQPERARWPGVGSRQAAPQKTARTPGPQARCRLQPHRPTRLPPTPHSTPETRIVVTLSPSSLSWIERAQATDRFGDRQRARGRTLTKPCRASDLFDTRVAWLKYAQPNPKPFQRVTAIPRRWSFPNLETHFTNRGAVISRA
jgi:hypothetical protein